MGISEKKFWKMTPRVFISMLDEWWRIQRILHGQNPDEDNEKQQQATIGIFDNDLKNPYKKEQDKAIKPNIGYIL